jgi:SAM-dependent methyltransferase
MRRLCQLVPPTASRPDDADRCGGDDVLIGDELYAEALRGGSVQVRYGDGRCRPLPAWRWLGEARGADLSLIDRVFGPALDVGCGPGRLAAALAARGVPTLGIDPHPEAVRLTRRAGGAALQRSVFDPLPAHGRWGSVMLADGNIGIGGDPARLLRRAAGLVRPGGLVLVELSAPGGPPAAAAVRLQTQDGRRGGWFDWASVPSSAVEDLCRHAGLVLVERWNEEESESGYGSRRRWFASAVRP